MNSIKILIFFDIDILVDSNNNNNNNNNNLPSQL